LGARGARELMASRLPIGTEQALTLGLIDAHAGPSRSEFAALIDRWSSDFSDPATFAARLHAKREQRASDEFRSKLAACRAEELECMRLNFYGFDPSYHIARHRFVHRTPHAWTPLYLARHRQLGYVTPLPDVVDG
jgi:putative two-component system hydrogenase maturation factor HypX/HoxX